MTEYLFRNSISGDERWVRCGACELAEVRVTWAQSNYFLVLLW